MRIWMLATGAAALAMTAPALADRGGGHGGGHGGGKGQQAQAQRGGGGNGGQQARARGGAEKQMRADRRGGQAGEMRARQSQPQRFAQPRTDRADKPGKARFEARREDRREAKAFQARDRGQDRRDLRAARIEDRFDRQRDRFAGADKVVRVRDFDRGEVRFRDIDRDELFQRRIGWVDNCPPGLAKKNNGCLPPGQAAKFIGQPLRSAARLASLSALPDAFRPLYLDTDDYYYRYGGGYVYRVDRDNDLIDSLIPLFGAALLGQRLQPNYVNSYYQPSYFSSFYPNSPYDCYRYGYGYVYETDCATGLVEDVIPTYDYGYGVGQVLPASYGYYNLPYAYRGYYADNDDYYYRYAPGAIYQVDRDSSLITAVAALLTGGLSIGQPLPAGYSTYNVPLAYRSAYYDTPDRWYRYDNGYIYSVDPTTQLVTAIVRALV